MPKLHKILAIGNTVQFQFREWDGIDRPDITAVTLTLEELNTWQSYLAIAEATARQNDRDMAKARIKTLSSEETQCRQRLQAIADELAALGRAVGGEGLERPQAMPAGRVVGYAVEHPLRAGPPTARVNPLEVTTQ